jgi:uncharacterized integral membrane protein
MKNKSLLYVFIIVVIIIVLIILICSIKNANVSCVKYQNYLTGMWVGDAEFIKKSDLSDLRIFISPREKRKRNGYIIMLDKNEEFILNQPIELEEVNSAHNQRWSAHNANKKIDDGFNIQFNLSTDVKNSFPKKLNFLLSIIGGVLTITGQDKNGNNKVYALMTKDLIASAEAVNAYQNK